MNIALVAGGTMGHISPAIVILNEIKKKYPLTNIYFFATKKDEKYEVLKNSNIYKNYFFESYGLSKSPKRIIKNISTYYKIKKILKQEHINKVFGFGGYLSGIALLAAHNLKLKTYLHEQNSIMGKANRYISKYVDKVFLSYPLLKNNKKEYLLIGNPVYIKATEISRRVYKERNVILFTSGSLGSETINKLAVKFAKHNLDKKVIIVTGNRYFDKTKEALKDEHNVEIYPFVNNLVEIIARSEIVISRAGASTLFEIIATKTPSIIIPSPNVKENHQYFNALYFKRLSCIELIKEDELTDKSFDEAYNKILNGRSLYLNNLSKIKYEKDINENIEVIMSGK